MVTEVFSYANTPELMGRISSLITFFQAVGGMIIAYIVFQVVRISLSKKRKKELEEIKKIVKRIEKKVNKLS